MTLKALKKATTYVSSMWFQVHDLGFEAENCSHDFFLLLVKFCHLMWIQATTTTSCATHNLLAKPRQHITTRGCSFARKFLVGLDVVIAINRYHFFLCVK